MKILVVGIGGVGGYVGGRLAGLSGKIEDLSIYFMARGKNPEVIKRNGLQMTEGDKQWTVHPDRVSDRAEDFGEVDYIILCTKAYDLRETVESLKPCLGKSTVILPLLNGVDNVEIINELCSENLVPDGCIYIISRLTEPGHVHNLGQRHRLVYGLADKEDLRLNHLQQIFLKAGLNAVLTPEIITKVWEKFVFISTTATLSSYYNKTYGELRESRKYMDDLDGLLGECLALAVKKGVSLPEDIRDKSLKLFNTAKSETTTSIHTDFLSGKGKTELESLTGFIVREASRFSLEVPVYTKMYESLKSRQEYY